MIEILWVAQLAHPNVICYEQLKDGQIRDLSHLCGKNTPSDSTVDSSETSIRTLPPNNRSLDSNGSDDPSEEVEEQ